MRSDRDTLLTHCNPCILSSVLYKITLLVTKYPLQEYSSLLECYSVPTAERLLMLRNSVVPPSSGSVRTLNLSSPATVKSCHNTTYCCAGQERPGIAQSLSWRGYRMDDWWVNRRLIPGTVGLSLFHSIRSEAGGPPTLTRGTVLGDSDVGVWSCDERPVPEVVTTSLWRATELSTRATLPSLFKVRHPRCV